MNPKGQLRLKGVNLRGTRIQYAFVSLQGNMSSLYNLTIEDCRVSDFDYLLKGHKYSVSEYIKFKSTLIKNCANGLELSEETDDRGDYNAENIFIDNCRFEGINKNVIDYYSGGYDESTVGGNLMATNSTFTQWGGKEENGILMNSTGIINVDLSGNKFLNNRVKLIARPCVAKNNTHPKNENGSERLPVEENLPLNLMYKSNQK